MYCYLSCMKPRPAVMKALALGVIFAVFTGLIPAQAADTAPFADVDATDLHAEALTYLKAQGAIQGYEDGTFRPEKTMNRAEALKMLYVGVKEDIDLSPSSEQVFPDVKTTEWYAPYVAHAQSQGVVKGYPDGSFKPANSINKAEALKILLNIVQEDTNNVSSEAIASFSAGQKLWYAPFLLRSYDLGLVDALNPEEYTLAGDVTRGELAEMLYRVLYIREKGLPAYPVYDTGRVSYYSDTLAGNNTSSGEKYDPQLFTAAHREAPLKSFIQVIDPASKKSVLVRVNDRGPGDVKGVADLSRAAFEVFYTTSKGVFDGTVYKLPAQIQTPPKTYVRSDIFANVTLQEPLPNIFWQDELYALEVAGTDLPVLNLKSPSGKTQILEALPAGRKTTYQLSFPEAGTYTLELPGSVPKRVSLTVLPHFQGKKIGEMTAPAATFKIDRSGVPALAWSEALPNTLLRVVVSQGKNVKTLYVNAGNTQQVALYGPLFDGFDVSKGLNIEVNGALTSTRFSHDVYTDWQRLAVVLDNGSSAVAAQPVPSVIEPALIPSTQFSKDQQDVLERINQERAKVGAAPLQLNATLNTMAQFKTDDMATKNYFSHTNGDGKDVNGWKDNFGWVPMVAENIAYSTEGVTADVENLIKSPGHYANMIDTRFELLGVGIAVADGKTYMTQQFSTRPVSAADLTAENAVMRKSVTDAGVTAAYDGQLAAVAQRWANNISAKQLMSFTIDGKDVGDVLRSEIGNYSFSFSVYADVGVESLRKDLVQKMSGFSTAAGYGFGLATDKDGMIRLTIVIKK